MTPKTLLQNINRPQDLHGLSEDELTRVAQEVREHIIATVGEIGGHFGANLGTCELAVALHSLLDSPRDKILWDVGHQAYPHKVLTGRRDQLATIRQYEGLAPFCAIGESEHDIMGAGHASTSIGIAVGIKEAMKALKEHTEPQPPRVVAVIGDGAMTGGVAFEALQQAGGAGTPMVVVLNDNGMSIAPNVGALSRYFTRVRLHPKLWHTRESMENRLSELPGVGRRFERYGPQMKESIKAFWAPGLLWEELGWAYTGVIDGHDVHALRLALRTALAAQRPVLVHIATVKGKGFAPAEEGGQEGQERWHAAKPKSIANGVVAAPAMPTLPTPPPQFTTVFGDALVEECRRDRRVVGITAAMNTGTGLNILQKEMPERYFDVGIAEQQAILFAAGLALEGVKPVAAIYSTFLQRAYDQIVHDVCLQKLNVVFALDRAGLVGDDGPDAPRRLRHRLHAPAAEHRPHGAARRGDARAHAAHRAALRRRPDRAALPARRGARRAAARRARTRSRSAAARSCARATARSRSSATAPASPRASRPPTGSRSAASTRRSSTRASPSRSTPRSWPSSRPSTSCS